MKLYKKASLAFLAVTGAGIVGRAFKAFNDVCYQNDSMFCAVRSFTEFGYVPDLSLFCAVVTYAFGKHNELQKRTP